MNDNVTAVQKAMLKQLAMSYDERLLNILRRGDDNSVVLASDQEAAVCESFAESICDKVLADHPAYDGADMDINQDAELATFIMSKVIYQYSLESRGYGPENPAEGH
jgi:hypothetical protein